MATRALSLLSHRQPCRNAAYTGFVGLGRFYAGRMCVPILFAFFPLVAFEWISLSHIASHVVSMLSIVHVAAPFYLVHLQPPAPLPPILPSPRRIWNVSCSLANGRPCRRIRATQPATRRVVPPTSRRAFRTHRTWTKFASRCSFPRQSISPAPRQSLPMSRVLVVMTRTRSGGHQTGPSLVRCHPISTCHRRFRRCWHVWRASHCACRCAASSVRPRSSRAPARGGSAFARCPRHSLASALCFPRHRRTIAMAILQPETRCLIQPTFLSTASFGSARPRRRSSGAANNRPRHPSVSVSSRASAAARTMAPTWSTACDSLMRSACPSRTLCIRVSPRTPHATTFAQWSRSSGPT
jgi:hypothetical protein